MDQSAELLLTLLIYLALAAPAGVALAILGRFAGAWFPLPRLRRGVWSGGEVFLCAFLYIAIPSTVVSFLDASRFFFWLFDEHVAVERQANIAQPIALTLWFAVSLTLLHFVSGTRPSHLGLTPARWTANVRLGLAAFCLATPVILGIYAALLLVTRHLPHPFETIAEQRLHLVEWIAIGINAMIVAPILEEWLCRGVIQGWLRRTWPLGHAIVAVFTLTMVGLPTAQAYFKLREDEATRTALATAFQAEPDDELFDALGLPPLEPVLWEAPAAAAVAVAFYLVGVLRLWRPVFEYGMRYFVELNTSVVPATEVLLGDTPVLLPQGPRWEAFKHANARWAIFGSALLFAFAHHAWPAQIPLLLFGLVAGWLQYRTQSLIPGIVFHCLFNTIAFILLILRSAAAS